jgi:hypothetical protein
LLREITHMGVAVKEVPVVWTDAGGSTLRLMRDGARAAADLHGLARRRPT